MIRFGKHRGKSAELLVLKHADYAVWMLRAEGATGMLAEARRAVRRLVQVFDAKPILKPCQVTGCRDHATRCSLYHGSVAPRWWCDSCDPAEDCFSPGKLEIVQSYREAVEYVNRFCGGRKSALKVLVQELAQAKGLPARVGEEQARVFFS